MAVLGFGYVALVLISEHTKVSIIHCFFTDIIRYILIDIVCTIAKNVRYILYINMYNINMSNLLGILYT